MSQKGSAKFQVLVEAVVNNSSNLNVDSWRFVKVLGLMEYEMMPDLFEVSNTLKVHFAVTVLSYIK